MRNVFNIKSLLKVFYMSVNFAVIGTGYWGKNHVRVLHELHDANLSIIADQNVEVVKSLARQYHTEFTTDVDSVVNDEYIDCVVICTPNSTHYELAKKFLLAGKHVFVEKPLCLDINEAVDLINISKSMNLVLMVGHVFSFNPAVRVLKDLIDTNELGDLSFFMSSRLGLFTPRSDSGVIYDLAIHDIDIVQYLLNRKLPVLVQASGKSYLQKRFEEIAFLSLEFENNFVAQINASWLTPAKTRNFWISGYEKTAYVDLISQVIEVFEQNFVNFRPESNNGVMYNLITKDGQSYKPFVSAQEPLKMEVTHFIDSVLLKKKPLTDGDVGLSAMLVCEAAIRSVATKKAYYVEDLLQEYSLVPFIK